MAGSVDEINFVLNCLRLHFGSSAAAIALGQAIKYEPDWCRILTIAKHQGVVPLLRQSILQLDGTPFPETVELEIRRVFGICAANSMLYARELTFIQSAFEGSGLRALALKGPALAVRLYGKLSLRPCRDLDLLVSRADLARAI